jgi:polysaccharide export outer membrane protein
MNRIYLCRISFWLAALLLAMWVSGAQAADNLLGPGDIIKVTVFGNPDLSLETRVSEAGGITYPLLGEVRIGGLSPLAAEKKIAGLLDAGGYVRKPQVNIIVTQLQSQQVSVLGLVNKPGRYPIEGKRSLTDVIAAAGGIHGDGGDMVTVVRTRDGKAGKETVDLVDMVRSGDMAQNFELAGGDIIYVERAPRFYIYGEVQRPGAYRLERNMTVLQALSAGGGLTPRGTERGMRIKRRDAQRKLQTVDARQDDQLSPEDVVYVQESLF